MHYHCAPHAHKEIHSHEVDNFDSGKIVFCVSNFYPTALKGCRGIVFTHGAKVGWWVGGRWEKVCPGCISETVRCRKLILGRDIG